MTTDKIVIIVLMAIFMIGGFVLINRGNKNNDKIENQDKK
jgi:hypothetical protein